MRFRNVLPLLLALLCAVSCTPAATPTPSAGARVQVLKPLAMPGLDRSRTLRIYLPPSYASAQRRYPVIYMHDGQNLFDDATAYAGEWGVDESMDALARTYEFEAIVIGIDNGGDKRMNELSPWTNAQYGAAEGKQYLAFVVDVVKPFVDENYRTQPGRETTAIFGSSMGGLASHYAIHERPDVFGKAGVFSPSYWYAPLVSQYTRDRPVPAGTPLYLYAGLKEGAQMSDGASQMDELLRAQKQDVILSVVAEAEHNEAAWRAEFPKAVIWLFRLQPGGPK